MVIRDARDVASGALDTPGEPGGGRSDVDRMAGGLVGEDEDEDEQQDLAARQLRKKPSAWSAP